MKLKYVTDGKRHLICVPYSIENLHVMALNLGINRCQLRKNHYCIPKKRIEEIEKLCIKVTSKEIVEIIKSPEYAEIILSDEIKKIGAHPKDNFLKTQMDYNGDI